MPPVHVSSLPLRGVSVPSGYVNALFLDGFCGVDNRSALPFSDLLREKFGRLASRRRVD